jgi:hypothetical protein
MARTQSRQRPKQQFSLRFLRPTLTCRFPWLAESRSPNYWLTVPTVDPKYPQAIAIANILHHTSVFGNSPWEILHNGEKESPFFTSDYPAAIEAFDINTPVNRIVPLAPDITVRIKPDINMSGAKAPRAYRRGPASTVPDDRFYFDRRPISSAGITRTLLPTRRAHANLRRR